MVVRLDFTAKFEKLKKEAEEAIVEVAKPETPAEKPEESPVVEKTIPVVPEETAEVPDLHMPEPEKLHQKENVETVPAEGAKEVIDNMKQDVKKSEESEQEKPKEDDSSSDLQKKN